MFITLFLPIFVLIESLYSNRFQECWLFDILYNFYSAFAVSQIGCNPTLNLNQIVKSSKSFKL